MTVICELCLLRVQLSRKSIQNDFLDAVALNVIESMGDSADEQCMKCMSLFKGIVIQKCYLCIDLYINGFTFMYCDRYIITVNKLLLTPKEM